MILPDANLFIYAFRAELARHERARRWWRECFEGTETIGLHPLVECAFLHLTTKPLGPLPAAPFEDAIAFLQFIHDRPVTIRAAEGPAHLPVFRQLCEHHGLAGDDMNGAWLAALALEQDATLASADRGFERFAGLRWINPFDSDEGI